MANLPATETFPELAVCIYVENSKQLSGEGTLWNPSRLNGGREREGMPPSTGKKLARTEAMTTVQKNPCDREKLLMRQRDNVTQASSSE